MVIRVEDRGKFCLVMLVLTAQGLLEVITTTTFEVDHIHMCKAIAIAEVIATNYQHAQLQNKECHGHTVRNGHQEVDVAYVL